MVTGNGNGAGSRVRRNRFCEITDGAPTQECWTAFQDENALERHVEQFHPSKRPASSAAGTPVVVLGFDRQELDAMEELAWPSSIQTWIHAQVTAALGRAEKGMP